MTLTPQPEIDAAFRLYRAAGVQLTDAQKKWLQRHYRQSQSLDVPVHRFVIDQAANNVGEYEYAVDQEGWFGHWTPLERRAYVRAIQSTS